jgi:trk system potassium uptake protein TrkA
MARSVLVVGLGRFGTAAALELMRLGNEVLAVDLDEDRVNALAADVTHAVQLDASDDEALRSIGAGDFEHAIVAISGEAQASIFATMALKTLGVRNLVAKAGSRVHAQILSRVGADRVVFAEAEMGAALAHTLAIPAVLEYLDVAPRFGIAKVPPPPRFEGRRLGELDVLSRLGLTSVALRRGEHVTVNPGPEQRIERGDELILIGLDESLERLFDVE